MTRLVIFDFDGLMVNSEHVVFAALRELFERHGHDFTWDFYCTTIGLPSVEATRMYLASFPLDLPPEDFVLAKQDLIQGYMATELALMPGLIPLLDGLRARGLRMVIASSSRRDYILPILGRFGLHAYFDAVVCIDDVARGKPHPDLVLKALEIGGASPCQAIMLEDSPHGTEAARRAGVRCIAIPTQGVDTSRFAYADAVVADLDAARPLLYTLLEQMLQSL
jgi:HAD superfamily hydrolase (TIGR01509 family)